MPCHACPPATLATFYPPSWCKGTSAGCPSTPLRVIAGFFAVPPPPAPRASTPTYRTPTPDSRTEPKHAHPEPPHSPTEPRLPTRPYRTREVSTLQNSGVQAYRIREVTRLTRERSPPAHPPHANPAGATLLSRIKPRPSNHDPDPTPAGDGVPTLEPPSPPETMAGRIAPLPRIASRIHRRRCRRRYREPARPRLSLQPASTSMRSPASGVRLAPSPSTHRPARARHPFASPAQTRISGKP